MGNCNKKEEETMKLHPIDDKELASGAKLNIEDFGKGSKIESSHKFFEIDFEDIKVLKSIGSGGSNSFVYKALWKEEIVAFKCFKTETTVGKHNFEEFEKEASIFSVLRHPNILSFFGCCVRPPRVGIVMELCEYGDLELFIENHPKFPMRERIRILKELSSALKYLHSNGIIHRDLKLNTVMVDGQLHVKLMDFGLSRVVESNSVIKTKRIGTSLYMAPEVAGDDGMYDEKCDVFSYGICMFITLTGNSKPYGEIAHNLHFKVRDDPTYRPNVKEVKKLPTEEREEIISIMKKCWEHLPDDRMSFEEVYEGLKKVEGKIPDAGTKFVPGEKLGEKKEEIKSRRRRSSGYRSRRRSSRPKDDSASDSEEKKGEGVVIFLKAHGKEDKDADDVILRDITLEGLTKLVCEWAKCEESDIEKMCKKFSSGLRKISKDSTVTKIEKNSIVVVDFKEKE